MFHISWKFRRFNKSTFAAFSAWRSEGLLKHPHSHVVNKLAWKFENIHSIHGRLKIKKFAQLYLQPLLFQFVLVSAAAHDCLTNSFSSENSSSGKKVFQGIVYWQKFSTKTLSTYKKTLLLKTRLQLQHMQQGDDSDLRLFVYAKASLFSFSWYLSALC